MPGTEVEGLFDELTHAIDALEAELPNLKVRSHIADVRRRIETLHETLRENRQLLETVLENSAASIYAKRKDGRYIYLNHEMEVTHDVTPGTIIRSPRRHWRANWGGTVRRSILAGVKVSAFAGSSASCSLRRDFAQSFA
jgi:PAS domain-containing protein